MDRPFFSIVTASLQRESLHRCVNSVLSQSFSNWEHVVIADVERKDYALDEMLGKDERRVHLCSPWPFRNSGNTPRHLAWHWALGTFVMYLDDDNFLADEHILRDMATVLVSEMPWALFPILRHGQHFYNDPPGVCAVDTANMVIRNGFAQWPDRNEYTLDGIFCEQLVAAHPNFARFPNFRPIVVMESSGHGQ